MSAEYLDILSADLTVTALANREPIDDADSVARSLMAWASEIDEGIPPEIGDYGAFIVDGGRRHRMRATALITACVLAVTSTGVAVAVGAHPFNPVVRLLKQLLNPDAVHPMGAKALGPGVNGGALEVRSVIGSSTGAVAQVGDRTTAVSRGGALTARLGRPTPSSLWPSAEINPDWYRIWTERYPYTAFPPITDWPYPPWGSGSTKTAVPITPGSPVTAGPSTMTAMTITVMTVTPTTLTPTPQPPSTQTHPATQSPPTSQPPATQTATSQPPTTQPPTTLTPTTQAPSSGSTPSASTPAVPDDTTGP